MNRKGILGIAIISLGFVVTGCGSNGPEDIVKDYIEAWDSGAIEKIVKFVDKETKDVIEHRMNDCVTSSSDSILNKELKKYLKEVDTVWRTNNPFVAVNSVKKPSEKFNNELNKIAKNKSLDNNEKILQVGLLVLDQVDSYSKVKSEMSPVAYKMLAFMLSNKMRMQSGDLFGAVDKYSRNEYFKALILEEMKKNDNEMISKAEDACADRMFHPNTLDEVNIIETKELSADQKDVKVELLYKDKSSKKKHIRVEKIAGEWRATTTL